MSRHIGSLPDSYKKKLEAMTIEEIAVIAANFRSKGRTCGTATARILQWTLRHKVAPEEANDFMALYRAAWEAEKVARAERRSKRPEDRPVKGGRTRPRRNSQERHSLAYSC